MGLRISRRAKEPFWIDLDFGIRMKVRPLQSPMLAAIRAKATRLAKAMEEPQEAEKLLGIMDCESMSPDEIRDGLFHHFITVLLGQCAIIEWEGVFKGDDETGEPLPEDAALEPMLVSEDSIAEVMLVPLVAERFYARYTARQSEITQEGNGSGLSLTGTSAAARPIAPGVSPAAAPHAPTRSIRRKPAKAKRP